MKITTRALAALLIANVALLLGLALALGTPAKAQTNTPTATYTHTPCVGNPWDCLTPVPFTIAVTFPYKTLVVPGTPDPSIFFDVNAPNLIAEGINQYRSLLLALGGIGTTITFLFTLFLSLAIAFKIYQRLTGDKGKIEGFSQRQIPKKPKKVR